MSVADESEETVFSSETQYFYTPSAPFVGVESFFAAGLACMKQIQGKQKALNIMQGRQNQFLAISK